MKKRNAAVGLSQGYHLGPFLFFVYTDDVNFFENNFYINLQKHIIHLKDTIIIIFAGDVVLIKESHSLIEAQYFIE